MGICSRSLGAPFVLNISFIPWGFLRVSVPGHWGLPLSGILHSSLGDFMRGAVPGHWRLSLSGILHTMGDS